MTKRIQGMLQNENKEADIKLIGQVVLDTFPDFRNAINVLDGIESKDIIELRNTISNTNFSQLVEIMKAKDFTKMTEWVEENCKINSGDVLFSEIYNRINEIFVGPKKCQAIMDLCDYQHKYYFAKDKRITILACVLKLSSLM